ncbi:Hypothetical protein Minf_1862 [Methylacidiphilum infernorum V4]|uniref:Uncharacterized protein n=1 Tax=Methylacidiphilum infernorum (isolate V4) TaxID=481448 RepID=B3DXW4_METI4|nr:Hypothetical protein Minf_1862 [Methylacidiphilum infernorum V4]
MLEIFKTQTIFYGKRKKENQILTEDNDKFKLFHHWFC